MKPEHPHPRILEFTQRIITQRPTAKVIKTQGMIDFDKQPAGLKLTSGTGERTFHEVTLRFNQEKKSLSLLTLLTLYHGRIKLVDRKG